MNSIDTVCVYAGSSRGRHAEYARAAARLGTDLAERSISLVYGGARIGLMGELADAALAAGGHVIGVIPTDLVDAEVAHNGLTQLQVVDSMHDRKARMAELADAFIALPGGLGTFEELFEVSTWTQLGLHPKPVGILDVAGYYEPLMALLDRACAEGFLRTEHRGLVSYDTNLDALLETMAGVELTTVKKWI